MTAHRRSARQRAMYRRRRLGVAGVFAVVVGVIVALAVPGGGSPATVHRVAASAANTRGPGGTSGRRSTSAGHAWPPPAVEAGLLPWSLPNPLSRMVVLPQKGSLVLAGGLNAEDTSSSAVSLLDPATGSLRTVGSLPSGVHDAAGAVIGGSDWVFGGGAATVVPSVESLVPSAGDSLSPGPSAALPAPRADVSSATIGDTAYVLGGFDGNDLSPAVLATTDGRTFTTVANLPVPVRYTAVAALGGDLYLFGGLGVPAGSSPSGAVAPVDDIQRVDPATHSATVVGHLPYTLAGASAATLGGTVYLAGGTSSDAPPTAAGVGRTQLLDGFAFASVSATTAPAPVSDIWAFNPATGTVALAGTLQVPEAFGGIAVEGGTAWLIGGEDDPDVLGTVQSLRPNPAFGRAGAPGAGSPYYGDKLLISDSGNDRLLLMDAAMHVEWTYPGPSTPPAPLGFSPDGAFFAKRGTTIVADDEQDDTVVEIAYPSGKTSWSYGHPKVPGTASGFLNGPDDAHLLKSGQLAVADAGNCRVLVVNRGGTVSRQIGTDGVCVHHPPKSIGSPSGAAPLADGNLLVSEVNGSRVSEYTPGGKSVWSVRLPLAHPSDPQQLGAAARSGTDGYLVADDASPGRIVQFTRKGRILADYHVTAGPGELDHPSAVEETPSGMYLVDDDQNHRMLAIDPRTGALVWQYGLTGNAGSGPGQLDTPGGFDLLGPGGTTPAHPQTG